MAAPNGKQLSEELGLQVQQSRYGKDGKWYENPKDFPCAFHDTEGYMIVDSLEHWESLQVAQAVGGPFFAVGQKTNVKGAGIKEMPGYVRRHPPTQITPEEPEAKSPPFSPLPPAQHKYTIQDIISDGCFLEESRLSAILDRLRVKKNLILQGPPGTGKTWLAKRLAFALIGSRSDRKVRPFQFHPNLSYEEFVRGWRPSANGKLDLVDGHFLKAINDSKDDPSNSYVVVIEEINRGNPAQIFGEMLTLLEADKRSVEEALALSYPKDDPSERVYIPPNLYVIGTMNLADRSLALVDFALRRRFAFFDLEPALNETWRDWVHRQCEIPTDFLTDISRRIGSLNDQIAADPNLGRQFRIGHSFVVPKLGEPIAVPEEWFIQVVETEIAPLLGEYWFDDPDKADKAKSQLLSSL